jgi:autotransporter-associated beta strand protein
MRSATACLLLILSILCSPFALAETWTGNAGAGTPQWGSPSNWGGVVPAAGAALVFPAGVTQRNTSNNLTANLEFGPLTFHEGGYVLSGNAITLDGGINVTGPGTTTIALGLLVASPQIITVQQASARLTVSGTVSGAGGLTKEGPGYLVMQGTHTYTGATIVSGGALEVIGTLPGMVQLGNGYLIGTGAVGGITSLGLIGTVNPGTTSAGTLTSNGDVVLTATDALSMEITSTAADKLVVLGGVSLGGAAFNVALESGFDPPVNTTYVLIDNNGSDPTVLSPAAAESSYLSSLTLNTHPFQLSLVGGDGNDVVLQRVPSITTTTTLSTSDTSTAYGDSVTLTAQVTSGAGSPASGQVVFRDGTTVLGTATVSGIGQAALTLGTILPGARKITAMFTGDTMRAPSRSNVIDQQVTGTATTTTLGVSPTPSSAPNTLVTLTATVAASPGPATGSVTFYDGASVIGTANLSGGTAAITTSTLLAGVHSLTAVYGGFQGFVGSTSPVVAHTVTGIATTTALTTSATPVEAGTSVTFTATVTSTSGTPPTGTVQFRTGAAVLGSVPLTAGQAAFTTAGLAAGSHSITAVYGGTPDFEASSSAPLAQTITPAPGGTGGGGGSSDDSGGGCGLGSGVAALLTALLFALYWRRER